MGKVFIKSDFTASQGFSVKVKGPKNADGKDTLVTKQISILPGRNEYDEKDIKLLKNLPAQDGKEKNGFNFLLGVSFHETSEKESKKSEKQDKVLLEKIGKLESQLAGFEGVDVAALKSQVAALESTVAAKDKAITTLQAANTKLKAK